MRLVKSSRIGGIIKAEVCVIAIIPRILREPNSIIIVLLFFENILNLV